MITVSKVPDSWR